MQEPTPAAVSVDDRNARSCSLVVPSVLVSVLVGLCAYSFVTAFSLLTESDGCISAWRVIHECQARLHGMRVPGWHETILAALCILAALEALLVTRPDGELPVRGPGPSRPPRLEPVVVACGLTAFGVLLDGASRGVGPFLATGVLLWLTWRATRSLAGAFATLERQGAQPAAVEAAEKHVAASVLLGFPTILASAGLATRFSEQRDMPHVSATSIVAAAVVYAIVAAALLSYHRYATLHRAWYARRAALPRPVSRRWLGFSVAILGVVLLTTVAAPPASAVLTEATAGLTSEIWSVLVGVGSHGAVVARSGDCRHHPRAYCLKHGKFNLDAGAGGGPHAHKHHQKAHHTSLVKPSGQFAAWLIPILAIVMLLAWRLLHRLGVGAWLRAVWNRLWRRQRRLVSAVVDRLPVSMVDPAGGGAFARIRRLTGRGEPTPREQILRYYGSTVTYAGSHLVKRNPAEAPEEYEETLAARLRRDREAWEMLTDEFVEARFSTHTIDAKAAADARVHWQATRGAILDASRAGDVGE